MSVPASKVFIREVLSTVDSFARRTITLDNVTCLNHKIVYNSVDLTPQIMKFLLGKFTLAVFTSAESAEIFSCLWRDIIVKLKNYSASSLAANREVHIDLWVFRHIFLIY